MAVHGFCPSDDEMAAEFENAKMLRVVELLWDSLKRDPEHKDRRQTGWGTKTKVGLVACLDRIYKGEY
jgi:hypothetical protein